MTTIIGALTARSIQAPDVTFSTGNGSTTDAPASTVLPAPAPLSTGGDPMVALAELLEKSDNTQKKMDRTMETSAAVAEEKEDAKEVQAMRDKADDVRAEGWVEGVADIGQGFCEMGAGQAKNPSIWKGTTEAFKAAGSVGGKQFEADGIQRDADGKADAAASKSDDRLYQMAQSDEKDAKAALDKVYDFLKSVKDSEASTRNAASSMRG